VQTQYAFYECGLLWRVKPPTNRNMAIQFARARYISRRSGGSAVRSAAYNGREAIKAERTGELFYFKNRDAPEHHEVLLPAGADERFRPSSVLWNTAEAAEKRSDAQVAREIVLALPANAEIGKDDRIELARSFAETHFVSKGLAVQLNVHAPHEGEAESERANWHAHLLITTRRLETDRFAAKKARDLDPEIRSAGGRAVVADGEAWGALWREHQDRYFETHGLELRVDAIAHHAGKHIGPVRMRRADSAAVERAATLQQANEEAARDPDNILTALTKNNATFTESDVDRYLAKHLDSDGERGAVRALLFERQDIIPLYHRETGETSGRFTTEAVRSQEKAALADGETLAHGRVKAVDRATVSRIAGERHLRADQRTAFEHATGHEQLAIIEGRAGTGKSYTLAAVREAYEQSGRRVIGLAPTNAVAQDLAADGFREARTVHSALFALNNDRMRWDRRTVVIVDEAAMLDSRVIGELLSAARKSGAKLILTGDDRQLASIERGGLFAELRQAHGAAEITEVTRQRVDWQRQAAQDLAEGRFTQAVERFEQGGAIHWRDDQDTALTALVAAWTADTAREPAATRFVFAYTNRDVNALNAALRDVRRERGEFAEPDVLLDTKHGVAAFTVGDRVQFTETDKALRIYNGNAGTITSLNAETGELRATLDSGRAVCWSAEAFAGFRHGYAGTIYKGQGKTLDHTYLYHTDHWRAAASYVALTRQRESAQVFVSRDTAENTRALARQMGRSESKAASVAWATEEDVTQQRKAQARGSERQPHSAEAAHALRDGADRAEADPRVAAMEAAVRSVSPAYVKAARVAEDLQRDAAQADQAIAHYRSLLAQYQAESGDRWQAMGALRQYGHRLGIGRDRQMQQMAEREQFVMQELAPLETHRAALAKKSTKAEIERTAAFKAAEPDAAAMLARSQHQSITPQEAAQGKTDALRARFSPEAQISREDRMQDLHKVFRPSGQPDAEDRAQRLQKQLGQQAQDSEPSVNRETQRQALKALFSQQTTAKKTSEEIRQIMQARDKPAAERRQGKDQGHENER
jgi:Ti-type conjugative transfer relaxase TraA